VDLFCVAVVGFVEFKQVVEEIERESRGVAVVMSDED